MIKAKDHCTHACCKLTKLAICLVAILASLTSIAQAQWVVSMNSSAQVQTTSASTASTTSSQSQQVSFDLVMNPFLVSSTSTSTSATTSSPVLFLPIYARPISLLGTFTEGGNGTIPSQYALGQNYPNPFNPSTMIRYDLPRASVVKLEVFDILGRRVATLVNGQMPAGRHEAKLDAGNLSSGQYLVRIQAGRFAQVRSITLMK